MCLQCFDHHFIGITQKAGTFSDSSSPNLHMSVHQTSVRILGNRSSGPVLPQQSTAENMDHYLQKTNSPDYFTLCVAERKMIRIRVIGNKNELLNAGAKSQFSLFYSGNGICLCYQNFNLIESCHGALKLPSQTT